MLACEPLYGTTQGFDGHYFSRLVSCLPERKRSTLNGPFEKSINAGKKKAAVIRLLYEKNTWWRLGGTKNLPEPIGRV